MVGRGRSLPREEFGDLYPFDSHFFDLEGHRYHYIDERPNDPHESGLPIVMVHGNPSWSFYFRGLVLALRGRHRCIVPDHMGCGWSDVPSEKSYEYTLERRVQDLESLVDSLDLDRVILIVHDWGGMIGSAWATENPERVAAMVVLNTGAFQLPSSKSFPPSLILARLPLLGAALVRGAGAFSRGANRYCVTRKPMPKAVQDAYLRPYDSWTNRLAVHRFVQDIPLSETERAWSVVDKAASKLELLREVPMLLCWGMRDFVFDEHFLAEWERRFPKARVRRYEDAGHYVLEDALDEVRDEVREFLETLEES